MTSREIIEKRFSCRAYGKKAPSAEIAEKIKDKAKELVAREEDLRIEVLFSQDPAAPAVRLSPSMFAGNAYLCAVLIAPDSPRGGESVGYAGQKLMLFATELGLGSCWVASTYDRASLPVVLRDGERIWDVLPMGYPPAKMPLKQKTIRAAIRAKDRKLESFVESEVSFAALPDWLRAGAEAVKSGPSAVNGQPIDLVYRGGEVYIRIARENHGMEYNDLGIAKAQFEFALRDFGLSGAFAPGDNARFVKEA